jgi:hypothetical protein
MLPCRSTNHGYTLRSYRKTSAGSSIPINRDSPSADLLAYVLVTRKAGHTGRLP